ncbi:MAG: DUF4920 domain-containing protein [Bacteroidia bacterium]|nr:DUF4920 domain-containing protein [Bacteroidia bacterium]
MIKQLLFTVSAVFILSGCGNEKAEGSFGKPPADLESSSISIDAAVSDTLLKDGDLVKLNGTISESCQHSGCWMIFKTTDGSNIYINTEDKFTIPKNSAGHKAYAYGKWVAADKTNKEKQEPSIVADGIIIK